MTTGRGLKLRKSYKRDDAGPYLFSLAEVRGFEIVAEDDIAHCGECQSGSEGASLRADRPVASSLRVALGSVTVVRCT